jgi:riboflavin biosynthesis pyrimidine reductase
MAIRINKVFGTSFSLERTEDFVDEFSRSNSEEADIVIVGGGPIGYAQALGFKKQNPNLKIVVLEKYNEFTRKHTLVMQAKHLESFMEATESKAEPRLKELLRQLKKSPNIRTNKLQETFREIAKEAGVKTIIETVDSTTIDEQILKYKPKLIIGADGTHSVVNEKLFPEGNQIKHEIDFAMQVRYEVDGDAESNWEESIKFYQTLARQGLVAFEQIGRRDDKTGKTPVTVQLIIPKEDFEILKVEATAKKPIKPFSRMDERADLIPQHLKKFITTYFAEKIKITKADPIDQESI